MKKDQTLPDQIVTLLSEQFCQCCESGEDSCVSIIGETPAVCPAFTVIQNLCPNNPLVIRVMGRYMRCHKCNSLGMLVPTSPPNMPIQPVYTCPKCGASLWRGRYGMLVDRPEDIHRSFFVKFVKEDGVLRAREVIDDEWLESLWGNDGGDTPRGGANDHP